MPNKAVVTFYKIHGCNNHFVVCWDDSANWNLWQSRAELLCNFTHGIGSDGLLVCTKSERADFLVMMFNPDGSRMGMCGNGLRCVVRFLVLCSKFPPQDAKLTLDAGERVVSAQMFEQGRVVELDLGAPVFDFARIPYIPTSAMESPQILQIAEERLEIFPVSMGNPHCVLFREELDDQLVRRVGPLIESHSAFPERCNVEFISVVGRDKVKLRVWERGVGETQACGSGACAAVVAGVRRGMLDSSVTVSLPGGDLNVRVAANFDCVFLRGPAEEIFKGDFFLGSSS